VSKAGGQLPWSTNSRCALVTNEQACGWGGVGGVSSSAVVVLDRVPRCV
jgi:hypothetical protein